MTVAELREELEKYPEDLTVEVFDHDFGAAYRDEVSVVYQDGSSLVLSD